MEMEDRTGVATTESSTEQVSTQADLVPSGHPPDGTHQNPLVTGLPYTDAADRPVVEVIILAQKLLQLIPEEIEAILSRSSAAVNHFASPRKGRPTVEMDHDEVARELLGLLDRVADAVKTQTLLVEIYGNVVKARLESAEKVISGFSAMLWHLKSFQHSLDEATDGERTEEIFRESAKGIKQWLGEHLVEELKKRAESDTEAPSNSAPTDETPTKGHKCILEQLYRSGDPLNASSKNLASFNLWTQTHTGMIGSESSQRVGPLLTASLYREKKAPLHHEFAVIGFGRNRTTESWIRVERAAKWEKLHFSSFAPMFGGAPLRESVSFAKSAQDLVFSPADELAKISITAIGAPIWLSEVGYLLTSISRHSPQYQLLTANCRFFAREVVSGLCERLSRTDTHLLNVLWRGRPATPSVLRQHIQRDPFGGRYLNDPLTIAIHAESLIRLADSIAFYNTSLLKEGMSLCHEASQLLERAVGEQDELSMLKSHAYESLSEIYYKMGKNAEGLAASRNSWEMVNMVKDKSSFKSSLYTCAAAVNLVTFLGRTEDYTGALEFGKNAIQWCRETRARFPSDSVTSRTLATCLRVIASFLNQLGRSEEAYTLLREAVPILSNLYQSDRNMIHREQYGLALGDCAWALSNLNRADEAVQYYLQAIDLSRQLFATDPGAHRPDLATNLYNLASVYEQMGQWDKACIYAREAVDLRKYLFEREPDRYRWMFSTALGNLAVYEGRNGNKEEEFRLWGNDLILTRQLYRLDPSKYRERLLMKISRMGQLLMEMGRMEEASSLETEFTEVAGLESRAQD